MRAWCSKRIFGVMVALLAGYAPVSAWAGELCPAGEVTDPQALHINGSKPFVYKKAGDAELRLHVFTPPGRPSGARSPAVVFFYGGGWIFGDIRRFQTQATHLALKGLVTVLADYRVTCRHRSTILDSIADAKSAMRWVRGHADALGVDPSRIAVVGSSAGGHLAAVTALVPGFDDPADKEIDARPNALILYNPALDTASPALNARIAERQGQAVADRGRDFSPWHHLDRGLPPTIIFQGDADVLTPHQTAETFCDRAKALDFGCEIVIYPGAPHGFAEAWLGLEDAALGLKTEQWQWDTIRRTDGFLTRLGWLPPASAPD